MRDEADRWDRAATRIISGVQASNTPEPLNVIGRHRRVMRRCPYPEPLRAGSLDLPSTWNVIDTNEYCWSVSPKLLSKLGVVALDDWLDAEPCKPHLRQVNRLWESRPRPPEE